MKFQAKLVESSSRFESGHASEQKHQLYHVLGLVTSFLMTKPSLVVPRGRPRRIRFYKIASFTPPLTDIYRGTAKIMRDRPRMNIQRQPKPRTSPTSLSCMHPLHTSTRVRVLPLYSSPGHSTNRASSLLGITSFGAKHSLGLRTGSRLAPAGSITAHVEPRTARAPWSCAHGTRRAA